MLGKYPFEGKLLDLMEKICHENIQLPTYLQHERHLFDLLNRMLQKNASERATVGQVLQHVWVSRDVDQELTLNHPCAVIGTVYRGLLPRTAIEHWTNVTSPIELAKGCLVLIRHTFDVWKSELNGRVDMVRPKPRTRYEDVYRSMSITPYLHQLHYPVEDARNRTEISEDEVDEFEQLRRIALVRSNRRRRFKSRYRQKHKLYAKFCHIMGFGKNELDT